MRNAIKKICAGVIVCAFAIGCIACGAVAERQKAKEMIREAEKSVQVAEEENEKRKEQYQDLLEKVPTRPSIPLPEMIQPSEPLDMVPSDTDAYECGHGILRRHDYRCCTWRSQCGHWRWNCVFGLFLLCNRRIRR